jgi:hypothetical protein
MYKILDHLVDELSTTAKTANLDESPSFLYICAVKHFLFLYTPCFLPDGSLNLFYKLLKTPVVNQVNFTTIFI